ncbi:DNA repair protein RadC [Enterococcus saccharolyticus]|uniref:RadC family protein n=1 Tax=Enterococcus TaxID=1350 RepID=UPI001E436601|nr:DNA repair protein RadC [Enterococcus saccharolyticus]MCD5003288.1 DNA repair protein RadC [Enterococcus saccharolyticus]
MEKKTMVPESSLPRERLLEFGEKALSNQELLAILLRTGSKPYHVLELAGMILSEFPNLYELKSASLNELQQIRGVGKIRAIELKAMMELGARIQQANQQKYGKVQSSFGLAQQLIEELKDSHQEHLICLYLNTKNEIIHRKTLFIGSLNQSIAHPREIYREAVRCSAARIICSHNHPSGTPAASVNDRLFTKRLKECGEMMGIELLDHLIVGSDGYVSLREEGFWEQ